MGVRAEFLVFGPGQLDALDDDALFEHQPRSSLLRCDTVLILQLEGLALGVSFDDALSRDGGSGNLLREVGGGAGFLITVADDLVAALAAADDATAEAWVPQWATAEEWIAGPDLHDHVRLVLGELRELARQVPAGGQLAQLVTL